MSEGDAVELAIEPPPAASPPAAGPGAVGPGAPPSPSPSEERGGRSRRRAAAALAVAALVAGVAVPALGAHRGGGTDGSRVVAAGPAPGPSRDRSATGPSGPEALVGAGPSGGAIAPADGAAAGAPSASRWPSGLGSTGSGGSGPTGSPGAVADVGAAAGGIASTYDPPSDAGLRSSPVPGGTGARDQGAGPPGPVGIRSTPESSPATTATTAAPPRTTISTAPPAPCRRGVLEPERSSFVFDGQSNSLSPTPDQSYAAKLMQLRWPSRIDHWANLAVGGSSFDQRNGWDPDRVDPWIARLGQPCAVLIQEGGPTDFANDLTAQQVLEANQRYTQARRAAGFDVIVGATTPPLGWITPAQDAQRRAYNDLLRRYWRQVGLDVLVDVAALPELQDVHDVQWFSDTTHFTDRASTRVAQLYASTIP